MERVVNGMNMEMLDLVRILCKKKIECMTIRRIVHKNIFLEILCRTACWQWKEILGILFPCGASALTLVS